MLESHNPKGCWRECAAATLALFCTIGLNINAFSVYIPKAGEELWSLAKRLRRSPESIQESNPNLQFPLKGNERIFVYRQIK
jgi:hypothetical protein